MKEQQTGQNHLRDLASKSFQQNIYTFSNFLSLAEQEDYHQIRRELAYASPSLYGGYENAERRLVRFGSEDAFGYSSDWPIVCIQISPLHAKFADDLSHRDFLGALMNLGIERSRLGDLKVIGPEAFVFCLEAIAPFILDNLVKVRHTNVTCKMVTNPTMLVLEQPEKICIQTASLRIDALIAKVCHLSRADALALFPAGKVFLNGRLCESNAKTISCGDTVNARGYGKFVLTEEAGLSRKGKLNVNVAVYR